jgi:hypothetical protein
MPEVLTMSIRVGQYLQLIGRIRHSNIKVVQAAEILGLSERHMYRLPLGYRSEGGQGLIHPPRGQATNRGSPKHVKKGVVPLYRQAYSCYGPISFGRDAPGAPGPEDRCQHASPTAQGRRFVGRVAHRTTPPQNESGGLERSLTRRSTCRLPRKLRLPHCRVIDEHRHDRRGLFHVGRLYAFVHVHVVMVRPAIVFNGILNKLEPR